MLYAIFQPYLVIYISWRQFPQLEEQIVPGSEPATFRWQLTTNYLSWDSNPSGERRVVPKRDILTTRPRRPLDYSELGEQAVHFIKQHNIY